SAVRQQKRATSLEANRHHMYHRNPRGVADINLRALLDDLFWGLADLLGDIVNVTCIEKDRILVLAALSAAAALEPELGIQVQQILFHLLRRLGICNSFSDIHIDDFLSKNMGASDYRMPPRCCVPFGPRWVIPQSRRQPTRSDER